MLSFNQIKFHFRSGTRYIYSFIKKYPAEHIIGSVVILMHLFPFAYHYKSKVLISPVPQKLQIATYTLPPINPVNITEPKQKKMVAKSKAAPPKVVHKDTVTSVQKICKKLQQIEQSAATQSTALSLPKLSKQPPQDLDFTFSSYQAALLEYLEKNILLPEQGTVDLQITLADNGKPICITVIHSTSKLNADFLCTELEKHRFPSFAKNAKEKTFILSFQSNAL